MKLKNKCNIFSTIFFLKKSLFQTKMKRLKNYKHQVIPEIFFQFGLEKC